MAAHAQQCQVCSRVPDAKLGFNCCKCSQELLYLPRLEIAKILLSREALSKGIAEAITSSQNDHREISSSSTSDKDAANTSTYDSARSQYKLIAARTQSILDDSRLMQEEIEKIHTQLASAKAALERKKRLLKSATQETRHEEESGVKPLRENIPLLDSTWIRLHNRILHDRHILPRELASLYGLQIRKRRKGSSFHDEFMLSGVSIFNIKELNNAIPEQLNTSTYYVAHLLHLTAHYLGVRLPAEISLATAGQPYTYIYPLMSSHKAPALELGHREVSSGKVPSRRRLLWTEKPLPQLASEDPQAYSLYLDAVILLAWDVAWLAKTQGIDVGGRGWEDICLVGKNLWDLFGKSSGASREETRRLFVVPGRETGQLEQPQFFSHSSSRNFLNSAGFTGAAEYMKTWKYAIPNKIIETIKSALLHERMGSDWEVLEKPQEDDLEDGRNELLATNIKAKGDLP